MLYSMLFRDSASDRGAFVSDGSHTLSIAALQTIVEGSCADLWNHGVRSGDRVIVGGDDPLKMAVSILSCIEMGAVFVPVHAKAPRMELEHIVRECAPKAFAGCRDSPVEGLRNIDVDLRKGGGKDVGAERPWRAQAVPEHSPCYILYTSGSTSRPKGVVGTQAAVMFSIRAIQERLCHQPEDVILNCLPLSFDFGLYQLFLALNAGASLVVPKTWQILDIPRLLQIHDITHFPAVPSTLSLLVASGLLSRVSLPRLRQVSSTGDRLGVALIAEVERILPCVGVVPMYGLTECKRVCIMPPEAHQKTLEGSCGKPLEGVSAWLEHVDETTGVGELMVAGPNVMSGYWGDEDATHERFPVRQGRRTLRTGDLFRIDSDGYLFFEGRLTRLIKCRGFRISPVAIEDAALSVEGVIEARALNIERTSAEREIVLYVWAQRDPATVEAELRRKLKTALPGYVVVERTVILGQPLPRTLNGKIDERALELEV